MTSAADLAALAALLADETRAAMCLALLDGRAWTAGELAAHTGVAPSTATGHLHRLVTGGLLVEHRQGRHRYVRLTDPSVATLLEAKLCETFLGNGWVIRIGSGRAVRTTPAGRAALHDLLGVAGID